MHNSPLEVWFPSKTSRATCTMVAMWLSQTFLKVRTKGSISFQKYWQISCKEDIESEAFIHLRGATSSREGSTPQWQTPDYMSASGRLPKARNPLIYYILHTTSLPTRLNRIAKSATAHDFNKFSKTKTFSTALLTDTMSSERKSTQPYDASTYVLWRLNRELELWQ